MGLTSINVHGTDYKLPRARPPLPPPYDATPFYINYYYTNTRGNNFQLIGMGNYRVNSFQAELNCSKFYLYVRSDLGWDTSTSLYPGTWDASVVVNVHTSYNFFQFVLPFTITSYHPAEGDYTVSAHCYVYNTSGKSNMQEFDVYQEIHTISIPWCQAEFTPPSIPLYNYYPDPYIAGDIQSVNANGVGMAANASTQASINGSVFALGN